MKLKTLLVFFLLSIFFMATQSSAAESSDRFVVACEALEQVEESEDNRNSLQPVLLLSYVTLDSSEIVYNPSFFLRDNFIDIEKPPIVKI